MIARLHRNRGFKGQPHIHSRAEPHNSNALAALHLLASLLPEYHAPRNHSRDLLENYLSVCRIQKNYILFIFRRSCLPHGHLELSGTILNPRNLSGQRRAIHMNIPNRQENCDSLPCAPIKLLVDYFQHAPVRR